MGERAGSEHGGAWPPRRVIDTLLASQYGLLVLDADLTVVWVSDAGAASLHHRVDEIVGRNAVEFLDPSQSPAVLDRVHAVLRSPAEVAQGRGWHLPERVLLRCGDGESRHFEFAGRAVDDSTEMMLVFEDVSDRARIEDVLIAAAEHDLEGALERFLWLAAEQLQAGVAITLHPSLGGSSQCSPGARETLLDELEADHPSAQVRPVVNHSGALLGWMVVDRPSLTPWDEQTVNRLVGVLALVLANQATFTHLVDAAATDALTGLSNRRILDMALAAASLSATQGWALLYCDLDRFKAVNDVHGHDAGDAVLRVVGQRLRQVVRSGDVIARMGGDEFVVLAHATPEQAEHLAERIRTRIAEPIVDRLGTFEVGISVGVATATTGAEVRGLLTAADDAMRIDKAIRHLASSSDR